MTISKTCLQIFPVLFFLGACSAINAHQAPDAFATVSVLDAFGYLPERKKIFANSLELYAEINNVQQPAQSGQTFEPIKIEMTVYFRNLSDQPLVIRLPQTIGFQGAMGGGDIWDLAFYIESVDGKKMIPTFNPSPLIDYEKIGMSDFITLEPEDTYSLDTEVDIPYFNYPLEEYHGTLLSGSYNLFFVYENFMIGPRLPMTVTPPPPSSFESSSQRAKWKWEHTLQIDLNACVGRFVSQKTEFTITE